MLLLSVASGSQHVNKLAEHSSDLSPRAALLLCVCELSTSLHVCVWECMDAYKSGSVKD